MQTFKIHDCSQVLDHDKFDLLFFTSESNHLLNQYVLRFPLGYLQKRALKIYQLQESYYRRCSFEFGLLRIHILFQTSFFEALFLFVVCFCAHFVGIIQLHLISNSAKLDDLHSSQV